MKPKSKKSSTMKNRAKAMKAQKQANKYAYRTRVKELKHDRFVQKQKTKRLSQLPESIKAAGQAVALASSPTAGSVASAKILNSKESQQMVQLINPTQVAGTNNAEEEESEKELNDKIKEYLPR